MTDAARVSVASEDHLRSVRGAPSLGGSAALVIGVWWLATGLTFAMQRADATGSVTRAGTFLAAAAGVALVVRTRGQRSASAARSAFVAASLLWWWIATLFYAGWGVSIPASLAGPSGSAALALQAVRATLVPDVVGVAVIVLLGALSWRHANRTALAAYLVFWGTLQTAKLNVFFGVRNPGAELLPSALAGLERFFGPARNSPLLVVTLLGLTAVTVMVARRGARSGDEHDRHAAAMLVVLLLLAVLEHALLGVRMSMPLWDVFLRMRDV